MTAVLSFPYVDSFSPPAPAFTDVILERPLSSVREEVLCQLDTGADATCIHSGLVSRLGLAKVGDVEVEGTTDEPGIGPKLATTYSVRIIIGDIYDGLTEVVELESLEDSPLLLGRDILNQFYLELWGPEMSGSASTDRPIR